MRQYKLIIFDFDGTLADSGPWFMRTLNDVASSHGFRKVSDEEIEMLRGRPNREIIRYLGVKMWQMPAIARDMRRRSAEAAEGIKLFEGIPGLLHRLAGAGLQIGVVSSNSEPTVRSVLGEAASSVGHYSCGASLFGKASKFIGLRRRLNLRPAEVLAVGDEGRDVEAAKKAGFDAAAVTWGYATEEALQACAPTFLARSVDDLAAICLGAAPEGQSLRMTS
jgi:phosphoglycolate phosphatase